jgi:ParB family transcriptional regulator, chromosome partitioning protein
MTTTAGTATTVPFSKLIASDAINARGAPSKSGDGIADLAASIASRGLIQPLCVRPSAERPDCFEVIDGRRRHAAIASLVKARTWAKATPVPVLIRNEDDGEALETSLVANTVRLPMHPVDQHAVFARLAAQGATAADLAARFGVAEKTVRQQMALGRLAPVIRDAWKKGKLSPEAAQAFTLHEDHAVQAATYERLKKGASRWGIAEHAVRSALEQDRPSASHLPAAVVDAYLARGGTLAEDLFSEDRFVDDAALLRTVEGEWRADRLAAAHASVAAQGWAWVANDADLPSAWRWQWDTIKPDWEFTEAQEQARDDLYEQSQRAADAGDDAEADRLEDLADDIEDKARLAAYAPEVRAGAGAVLSLSHNGKVAVTMGVVRPQDAGLYEADGEGHDETGYDDLPGVSDLAGDPDGEGDMSAGDPTDARRQAPSADEHEADDPVISAALLETITAAQTEAAAAVIATVPALALRLAVAGLRTVSYASPVKLAIEAAAHAKPPTTGHFERNLDKVMALDDDEVMGALARLIAGSLSLIARSDAALGPALALVEVLPGDDYLGEVRRTFLADDYFKRVTKAMCIAAIEEMREAGCGGGLAPEDVLAGMKKAELATAAATAARACGWLPEPLRHPAYGLAPADQRLCGKMAAAEQTGEAA